MTSETIINSSIWPARSPDVNPGDFFFFWVCLKNKVYNSKPISEEELKENIIREIANIPVEQLQRVNQNSSAGARTIYM
jgi:hypothetical protein